MSAAYQKRHYEAIAQLIKNLTVYGPCRQPHVSLFELTEALADLFDEDNSRFDRDRFFKAIYHG